MSTAENRPLRRAARAGDTFCPGEYAGHFHRLMTGPA
jgi:hypothetical protein